MGTYGNTNCPYCDESYYELDIHECDTQVLKNKIEQLRKE